MNSIAKRMYPDTEMPSRVLGRAANVMSSPNLDPDLKREISDKGKLLAKFAGVLKKREKIDSFTWDEDEFTVVVVGVDPHRQEFLEDVSASIKGIYVDNLPDASISVISGTIRSVRDLASVSPYPSVNIQLLYNDMNVLELDGGRFIQFKTVR